MDDSGTSEEDRGDAAAGGL